ncbi:hypothetical protein IAQ61_005333 [Plenodomus lingam]|uniref:uncharacterized protein n=1 Tax=Leptosphaeria maculans TaxID=5022 RepID=UPI0033253606|nr:hypothetical protein IAQ61_005333 [Plenodomus lingam]
MIPFLVHQLALPHSLAEHGARRNSTKDRHSKRQGDKHDLDGYDNEVQAKQEIHVCPGCRLIAHECHPYKHYYVPHQCFVVTGTATTSCPPSVPRWLRSHVRGNSQSGLDITDLNFSPITHSQQQISRIHES